MWGHIFPALKVPRQCPFFLLIEVDSREGKSLGSKEGEGLGCGFCYDQWGEWSGSFMCLELILILKLGGLH
jgi:hypothetical protein